MLDLLFFKMTSDGLNQTLSSDKLQHEQRRASATSHCKLNWSVGKHSIPYKAYTQTNYTEHSRKTFGNQLVMFLACMHVQMNILNSVPAVHITYLTVLPYGRYYSLKNAMAPRVSSEHITNTNIYQSSVINSSGMLIYQKCTSETY